MVSEAKGHRFESCRARQSFGTRGRACRLALSGARASLLVVLASVPLAALAAPSRWGPTWSEVTGALAAKAQMNLTLAVVKSVDGRSESAREALRKCVVRVGPRSG